jgi:outer membrane receptor protein involved in Fe transport
VDNSDLIGTSTTDNGNITVIQNAGRAVTYGWDLSTEVDLVGLADELLNSKDLPSKDTKEVRHSNWVDNYGSLSVYTALTLMDAKFLSGPNSGKTPQYSPDYLFRVGAVYNWRDRIKVALMGNFVGSSYADDTNTAQRFIPAYNVWDLTVEAKVYKDYVSIIGGVNNVFDSLYYARIRPDGIDPAMPRNWYVGAKVEF